MLRLLDVAYLLVFGGYILLTAHFDFGWSMIGLAEQVENLAWRVGGLVLTMGLLHAATITALPVVALIANSTRAGRALPRWLTTVLIVVASLFGLLALWVAVGAGVAGIQ